MPLAKVNGININYKVEGQGENLILIMGFQTNRGGWMRQTPFFKKHHYRVITFDNRGVGKSDVPEGPYSTRMMADDTIGLMDYLGVKKAHIVGISLGGMIAQEVVINYPERVSTLVLGSTYACDDNNSGNTAECAEAMKLPIRETADSVINLCFNKPLNRMLFIPWLRMMGRKNKPAGLSGQREAILKHNTLDRLKLIKAPTLIIVGTGDRVIRPISSEIMAKNIPNASLIKVNKGSHVLFTEMSGKFNKEVINFLKRAY
jgi:pimeloyl-ACP methyl ester carboxylesterase